MQTHTAARKLRVVLLAGLSLSGKTRLALRLRELGWDHIQCHSESNVASLQEALRSSLQAGRDVVVDSTNLTKADRAQWWSVAAQVAPPTPDGVGGVSQFVVISAVIPTGEEAVRLDPAHLQYRQQYLSPDYTAYLPSDRVVEYIHNVISALDPTFEVPYTTEGVDSLAHVRTQHEVDLVLGWLSHAAQFSTNQKVGWGTPPPSSAAAAAALWCETHNVAKPRPQPTESLIPPAPDFMMNAPRALPAVQPGGQPPAAANNFNDSRAYSAGQDTAANGGFYADQGLASGGQALHFPRPLSSGYTQAAPSPAPAASAPYHLIGSAAPFSHAIGPAHPQQLQYAAAANGAQGPAIGAQGHAIGAQGPAIGAQGPAIGAQGHAIGAQGPAIGAQGPAIGAQGHAIVAQGPAIGAQPSAEVAALQRVPWLEAPVQVKSEFDGVPSKRPYEHGPGASETPWTPVEVKRANVSAGPDHGTVPFLQQGLQQSVFQAQAPTIVVPHAALQGGQVVLQQQRPAFVDSQAQFNGASHAPSHQFAPAPLAHDYGGSQQLSGALGEFRRWGPPPPLSVDMSDPRPIILFELSGVLCNSTKDRMNTRTRNHQPRPGVGQLARLMPHFRIGIYSTATRKTVLAALAVVSSAIRGEIASSRDGWRVLLGGAPPPGEQAVALGSGEGLQVPPEHLGLPRLGLTADDVRGNLPWGRVFEEGLILHRDHTDLTLLEDRELTVKSLRALFPNPDMLRRILVVDELHVNQSDDNFVAIRRWDTDGRGPAARLDAQIPALVTSLLTHLPNAGGDVRSIARAVAHEVKAANAIAAPWVVYRPTDSADGYFEAYPQRPGAEPCQFYLETGHCRFAEGCHFHHPPERSVKLNRAGFPMRPDKAVCTAYADTGFCDYGKSCMRHHPNLEAVEEQAAPQAAVVAVKCKLPANSQFQVVEDDWTAAFPQRPGEPACTFFVQNGACRFGPACKFHHPLDAATPLNNYGLPMRVNAPVCDFFCRTGQCRFGVGCNKHHPILLPNVLPAGGGLLGSIGKDVPAWGSRDERAASWGQPAGQIPQVAAPLEFVDGMDGFFAEFAVNHGREPCPNFVRTGHCKFGLACQFHHPPEFMVKLNLRGLPLRPGAELCKFYLSNGECGYGRQCMFHHPNIAPQRNMPMGSVAQKPTWSAVPLASLEPAPRFVQPQGPPAFAAPQTMVIIPHQQLTRW